jgi:uncharacterized protein (DUF1810 family)
MEFYLDHFIEAQDPVLETVLEELRSGKKQTHWMWFIFPQLKALGRSSTAKYFGINDLVEAKAYLDNQILHNHLVSCLEALLKNKNQPVESILGSVDAQKLKSCITLFLMASSDPRLNELLDSVKLHFYQGSICIKTKEILEGQ